jgi:pimeloyl-ACP methyl ester carboxylesterase
MIATAFALHALGSDRTEFDLVRSELRDLIDVQGIDLPGFGSASAAAGTSVEDMVLAVEAQIGKSGATEWALIGHSMGGKIASVVASRTLSGMNGLFGLRAVVLIAASPLSPEPMDGDRRAQMIAWARHGQIARSDAVAFVDANIAGALTDDRYRAAVSSVERSSLEAWLAWLERGSREDWSGRYPTNPVPALVLAGAEDGDLGPDAQRELNLPQWSAGEYADVPGAAHLIPLEQPVAAASLIRDFWQRRVAWAPVVPAETSRVIASPRVSARTRGILAERSLPDPPTESAKALTTTQLSTLAAIARLTVPQVGDASIDLAIRVDAQLAAGAGDGWRPDGSPPDLDAYRAALDALAPSAGQGDGALASSLTAVRAGSFEFEGAGLTARQLRAWEEDAAVDLVRQWLAHPATLANVGYDGFANGGDGIRKQGFTLLGAGQSEAWEPRGSVR